MRKSAIRGRRIQIGVATDRIALGAYGAPPVVIAGDDFVGEIERRELALRDAAARYGDIALDCNVRDRRFP